MWLLTFVALATTIALPFQTTPQLSGPVSNSLMSMPSHEGTAQAQLTLDEFGRVWGCTIIKSSGNRDLDRQTCDILRKNAHFKCDRHGCVAMPITFKAAH